MRIEKRCPWCGVEPEDHDEGMPLLRPDLISDSDKAPFEWAVFCENCRARGPVRETADTAISAWNDTDT